MQFLAKFITGVVDRNFSDNTAGFSIKTAKLENDVSPQYIYFITQRVLFQPTKKSKSKQCGYFKCAENCE